MSNKQPANQLARGTVIGSIALAVGYLVQYLFQLSVSRTLEAEAAGTLFIAIAFVLLLSVIARFGLDKTGLKAVSVYFTENRPGTIREITLLLALLTGISSVLVGGFIIFGGSRLTALIALPGDDRSLTIVYAAIPLISLSIIFSEVLRGMRLIGRSSLVQLCGPVRHGNNNYMERMVSEWRHPAGRSSGFFLRVSLPRSCWEPALF